MKKLIHEWKHVFKLDPDRYISDEALEKICMSGTHAIMVGGSTGINFDNTVDLLSRVRRYSVPCVLEVSSPEAIVPGFDLYFIPMVLNTDDAQWVTGLHHQVIKEYGNKLPWNDIVTEGYVILNPQSTVARITQANTQLNEKDILSYAVMAEKLFQLSIFYIENSGTFGDMEIVKKSADTLTNTRLFYGGGIQNLDQALQASKASHTIVVGNIIYQDLNCALETVQVIEHMC